MMGQILLFENISTSPHVCGANMPVKGKANVFQAFSQAEHTCPIQATYLYSMRSYPISPNPILPNPI